MRLLKAKQVPNITESPLVDR